MAENGITFICPAKDEGPHIAETLTELYEAFSAQDYPFEMLCIDDGSGDDTGDEMERFAAGRPEVRVIHFEVNRGLGAACRCGYGMATQPYAMFVPTNGMLDPRSMFHKFGRRAPGTVIMFDIDNLDSRPLYRKIPSVAYHVVMTRFFGIRCGYIHSMLLLPTKAVVLDDLRAWRLTAQKQLRLWADDPALAASQGAEMRDRLVARMSSLEAQIGETIRGVKEGQISEGEIENFYRILGTFKSLSESGIEYSWAAEGIDWMHLTEERF